MHAKTPDTHAPRERSGAFGAPSTLWLGTRKTLPLTHAPALSGLCRLAQPVRSNRMAPERVQRSRSCSRTICDNPWHGPRARFVVAPFAAAAVAVSNGSGGGSLAVVCTSAIGVNGESGVDRRRTARVPALTRAWGSEMQRQSPARPSNSLLRCDRTLRSIVLAACLHTSMVIVYVSRLS